MNASKRKTWNVEKEKDSFYDFSGVVLLFPISLRHLQPKSFCYYVCDTVWYLTLKTKLEDEGKKGFYLALILFHGLLKLPERENTLEESWTEKHRKLKVQLESLWGTNCPQDLIFFSIEWEALSRPKFTSACCGTQGNFWTKPIFIIYFTGLNISVKLPVLKLVQFRLIFQISEAWRAYNFLKLSWRKRYVLGKHLKSM